MAISSINPATGQTLKIFTELTDDEVHRPPGQGGGRFRTYRRTSFAERSAWMTRAADILDAEVDRVAEMMTAEMGKTWSPPAWRYRSAPGPAATSPTTPKGSWLTSRLTPGPSAPPRRTPATSPSDPSSPSCPGTSRCGR